MRLTGIWPALLTPLAADSSVDLDALHEHASALVDQGAHGLVPLGTTGEFCEFSAGERAEVIRATVDAAAGRVPVLAGVTAVSTTETQACAATAEEMGASGVLVLPPLYWKLDDQGIYQHFRAVVSATDLPVVLYSFPALAGTSLPPEVIRRLALEEPRVVGVKLTVRDIFEVTAVLDAVKPQRPDFRVVTGFEDLLPALMWGGGDGAVSGMANFCLGLLLELYQALSSGDAEAAEVRHRELMTLFGVYQQSAPPILALKAATHLAGRPVPVTTRVAGGDADAVLARVRGWLSTRESALGTVAASSANGGAGAW